MSKLGQISSISEKTSEPENHASIECDVQKMMQEIEAKYIDGRRRTLEEFSPTSNGTIGDKYRFRAECHSDAELFIQAISPFIEPSWTMLPSRYYPDVVVAFSIIEEISPRDLLWIACSIVDGHVLVETLEKEDLYTGKRVYFRKLDVNVAEYKPSATVLKEMAKGVAHHTESLKYLLADAKGFAKILKAISH